MISIEEKIECVKWAKTLCVIYQKYEAASSLRVEEKKIAELLKISDYKASGLHFMQTLDFFNYKQLKYIMEIIEKYFDMESTIPEIVQLRRSNNINILLD